MKGKNWSLLTHHMLHGAVLSEDEGIGQIWGLWQQKYTTDKTIQILVASVKQN